MKAHYVKNDHIVSPKGLRESYTSGKFQKYQNLNDARRLSQLKATNTTIVSNENRKKTNESIQKTNPSDLSHDQKFAMRGKSRSSAVKFELIQETEYRNQLMAELRKAGSEKDYEQDCNTHLDISVCAEAVTKPALYSSVSNIDITNPRRPFMDQQPHNATLLKSPPYSKSFVKSRNVTRRYVNHSTKNRDITMYLKNSPNPDHVEAKLKMLDHEANFRMRDCIKCTPTKDPMIIDGKKYKSNTQK